MGTPVDVSHPGTRIKAEVIPAGMSITKAAQLMGRRPPRLVELAERQRFAFRRHGDAS